MFECSFFLECKAVELGCKWRRRSRGPYRPDCTLPLVLYLSSILPAFRSDQKPGTDSRLLDFVRQHAENHPHLLRKLPMWKEEADTQTQTLNAVLCDGKTIIMTYWTNTRNIPFASTAHSAEIEKKGSGMKSPVSPTLYHNDFSFAGDISIDINWRIWRKQHTADLEHILHM